MNNIDNLIENTIQKQIYEPEEFEKTIQNALNSKNKIGIKEYALKIIKTIMTLIASLIVTASVVFAKDISNWIYNIFNPDTTSKGIIKMAQTGYLQEVGMEYLESNGNSIKIENIIMDDYNLSIVFNVKTKDKIESTYNIEIPDLIISDENKNLIFCDYGNIAGYEKYCEENGIQYSKMNMNNNKTDGGYSAEIIEKTENNIKFLYKMYSSNYPKSKQLKIKLGTINLNAMPDGKEKNSDKIVGKWDIQIYLSKQFYEREVITYTIKDNSGKKNKIVLQSALASNTEMQIDITIKGVLKPIKQTEKDIEERMDFIIEEGDIIKDATLENEYGEKFGITTAEREGNFSKVYRQNGDIDAHMCFDITQNEYTDKLKLNLKIKDKDVTINLSK